MRKFRTAVALIGASTMVGPALAQDDGTPTPIAGVWSLGETARASLVRRGCSLQMASMRKFNLQTARRLP